MNCHYLEQIKILKIAKQPLYNFQLWFAKQP